MVNIEAGIEGLPMLLSIIGLCAVALVVCLIFEKRK